MKKIFFIMILCIFFTGCKNSNYISENIFYMDTVINIKIYDKNEKEAEKAINAVEKIFAKYENITNFYNENSELYNINNNHTETAFLEISQELYDLISLGLDWYNKSGGLLNINIGSITKIWHDFRNELIDFPTNDLLDSKDISINKIHLNANNQIFNDDFCIDLGSFVKGYVTEKAGQYLESIGFNHYIINAGGNVKVGRNHKGYYSIGIKSPNDNSNFYIIKDENISVVTSGGYERFFNYNGKSYHHIINPNTKYPANYMKSVTVIGKDSTLCDILSTALFLMPIEDGKNFVKNYDVDVIWYSLDDKIIKSEGFKYE